MASGSLGNLSVDLLLETAQWLAGLNKAEYQAKEFADAIETKFKKLGGVALEAFKGIAAGAAAAFSAKEIFDFVAGATRAADALSDIAAKTGDSIANLAQLSTYAGMAGTSIDSVSGSLVKLDKALVAASDSSSKQAEIFKGLGIATEGRASTEVLNDLAEAFARMEDGAAKTALAIEIFGKAGAAMLPVLAAMASASDELKAANADYAAAITRLSASYAGLEEAQTIFETRGKTVASLIAEQLVPYVRELYESINALGEGIKTLPPTIEFLVNAFKGIVIVIDLTITAFAELGIAVVASVRAMAAIMQGQWKEAAAIFTDGLADMNKQGGLFAQRMGALIDPLANATTATKKTTEQIIALDIAQRAAVDSAKALAGQLSAEQKIQDEANALTIKFYKDQEEKAKKAAKDAEEVAKKGAQEHARRVKERLDAELKALAIEQEAQELGAKFLLDQSKKDEKERERIQKDLTAATLAEIAIQKDAWEFYNKYLAEQGKKTADELKIAYGAAVQGFESLAHNAFNSLFSDTGEGWRGMLEGMAGDFKKMLVDFVYKQFAKPLVLNLLTNMPGGIGQYASKLLGEPGAGGMLGGAGGMFDEFKSYFGLEGVEGLGTMGTLAAGALGGIGGYGIASLIGSGERGKTAAASYGATGAAIGGMLGPWGALAGAIIGGLAGALSDPDPDAMRAATFGSTAGATGLSQYAYTSKLGSFGISDTKWFSDSDMGESLKAFIAGMKELDDAIASTLSTEELGRVKDSLAEFSKAYEFGMEHMDVEGVAAIIKDRLRVVVAEIAPEVLGFFEAFSGGVEELSAVMQAYLNLRNASDFDAAAAVKAIEDENEARNNQMLAYQKGITQLNELVAAWDGSAASTMAVTDSLAAFQMATVAMILAIDAAAAAMHEMFMNTADAIRQSIMSEEERYAFLQERSAGMFDQLLTETDPAKIQALAEQINSDINAAWGLLSDEQKSTLAESFLERLDALDEAVADKMTGLRDVIVEDSDSMMVLITERLEAVFASAESTAATNAAAANAQVAAANTPLDIVVHLSSDIVTATG